MHSDKVQKAKSFMRKRENSTTQTDMWVVEISGYPPHHRKSQGRT